MPPPPPPPRGVRERSRRIYSGVRAALLTTTRTRKTEPHANDPRPLNLCPSPEPEAIRTKQALAFNTATRQQPSTPPSSSDAARHRRRCDVSAHAARAQSFSAGLHQPASNCICSARPAQEGFRPNGSRARTREFSRPFLPDIARLRCFFPSETSGCVRRRRQISRSRLQVGTGQRRTFVWRAGSKSNVRELARVQSEWRPGGSVRRRLAVSIAHTGVFPRSIY